MNDNQQPANVTGAGRVLSAPGGVLFSDKSPMAAGSMRGLVFAFASIIVTGIVQTVEQWAVIPDWIKLIWVPILYAALRLWEAWIDQRSVVTD